ncbi:MAG: hypothetical protein ACOYJI_02990 [Anaerovoracaceae bacterium]|jgi:hypothetical protein
MLIRIMTSRASQYRKLIDKYSGSADFVCDGSADSVFDSGESGKPDIIIVDPACLSSSFTAAAIRKRAASEKTDVIVGDPGRPRSLERELAAAGLTAVESENTSGDIVPAEAETAGISRCRIGIAGLTDDSGAELITMMLAEELASELLGTGGLVTVYSPGDPYFYRALSLGSRFPDGGFKDVTAMYREMDEEIRIGETQSDPHAAAAGEREADENIAHEEQEDFPGGVYSGFQGRGPFDEPKEFPGPEEFCRPEELRRSEEFSGSRPAADGSELLTINEDEGICWAVSDGSPAADCAVSEARASFADRLEGVFVLRKYTCRELAEEQSFIHKYLDAVIAVADPLPSKMARSAESLRIIKECGVPVIYAVNRMNSGVDGSEILRFLGTYDAVFLPPADPELVYRYEYLGVNPYRNEKIRRQLMEPLCGLSDRIRSVCQISGI